VTDSFLVDVIYWQNPKGSVKLLAILLLGAPIVCIGLYTLNLRLMLVIGLWVAVFSNIAFFQDLTKILVDAAMQFDSSPI